MWLFADQKVNFHVSVVTETQKETAAHQSNLQVASYWFALTICELTNAPQSLRVLSPFKVWIPGIQ